MNISDLPINQSGKSGNKIPVRKLGFPPWIWPPPVRNSSPECAYVISTANFLMQTGRLISPGGAPVRIVRNQSGTSPDNSDHESGFIFIFSAECTNVGFGSTSRHAGILPGPTVGPIGPSRFLSFLLFVICFSHVFPDSPEPVRNQSRVSSRASAFVRPRT